MVLCTDLKEGPFWGLFDYRATAFMCPLKIESRKMFNVISITGQVKKIFKNLDERITKCCYVLLFKITILTNDF